MCAQKFNGPLWMSYCPTFWHFKIARRPFSQQILATQSAWRCTFWVCPGVVWRHHERRVGALRRFLGLVLFILGLAAATLGGLAVSAFGTNGTLQTMSPALQSSEKSYAIVADILAIDAGFPGSSQLGEVTIGAESIDGGSLFIGYGQRSDVNAYLAQVQFDAVTQQGDGWDTRTVPGRNEPGPSEDQNFWLDSSTGVDPDIVFDTAGSDQLTVVVMNQDQQPGVSAALYVGYESDIVFPVSAAALAVGAVLVVLGVVMMFRRGRSPKSVNMEDTTAAMASPAAPEDSVHQAASGHDRDGE